MNDPRAHCPHGDEVVARHLDGELTASAPGVAEPGDQVAEHPLDAHLQACSICQRQLRRARRLDALLAQDAGQFQSERFQSSGLEDRWFRAVAAEAATMAAGSRDGRPVSRPVRRLLAVAVATAAGLMLWLVARADRSSAGQEVPAAVAQHEATGGWPGAAAVNPPTPPEATSHPPTVREAQAVALDLRQLQHWSKARPGSNATAVPLLGQFGGSAPRADLVARLQDRNATVLEPSFLRTVVAADRAEVDDALRRRMRRHPQSLGLIAAATRQSPARRSAAGLLLDLWEDAAERSSATEDGELAQLLFCGQSAATFREVAELANCRGNAVRQRHCWLALGWSHDLDPTPELLAQLHGMSRETSLAAAFALSCQPTARLLSLAGAATTPHGFLMRAALWRNGAPELTAVLAEWPVSRDLREQLLGCSFPTFSELVDAVRHGAGAAAE